MPKVFAVMDNKSFLIGKGKERHWDILQGRGNDPPKSEGPAQNYHVIARRAKPDVAISCRNEGDCHGPAGLAMTWRREAGDS